MSKVIHNKSGRYGLGHVFGEKLDLIQGLVLGGISFQSKS